MPAADYMDKQAELKWQMRTVLMDWIIEVHAKFRLLPETLFIATNLIDRFLSARVVSVEKIQLVGITALFVASKYEEVMCPSITHFLNMADGGYDVNEMLKAERYLLQTLDFDMSYPNPLHFLRRISKADQYDIQTRTVSKYLIEIGCLEHRLLAFPPSLLAAAAMYLARLCLERGEWVSLLHLFYLSSKSVTCTDAQSPNLVHYSSYSVEELLPAAQVMLDYILDPEFNSDTVFHRKYAGKKHMKSSIYVRQWALATWPHSADGSSPYIGRELQVELEGNW
jgi:G2/mitotic-specific cyclin 1/2